MNNKPQLIEPGAKYFFNETLKNCNNTKINYTSNIINIIVFISIIIIGGLFLTYKFKGKKPKHVIEQERYEMSNIIFKKINDIKRQEEIKNRDRITTLPDFDNEYDYNLKKFI